MTDRIILESDTAAGMRALYASAFGTAQPPPSDGDGDTPPTGGYTDQNYPLTMPVITDGSPVDIGTGPDVIRISANTNKLPEGNVFALILDGTAIAGPLTCTANAPEDQVQFFTIRGTWGPPPHALQFVSGGAGAELANLGVQATYNFLPMGYTGLSLDARARANDDMTIYYGVTAIWDNIGWPFTLKAPPDAAPVTPPPPTPTGNATITGATINGTPHAPETLANLVAATPAGGTLTLPAGTWSGTASVPNACTIRGAGPGQTIIDATGITISRSKGIFVPLVAGVAFADMTLKGAAVSDLNGAGIREDAAGLGWTATNVEITGCQDGVLTFASNITLNDCNILVNGAHDGHSHELYLNGAPATTVTLNNVIAVCGSGSTHALKSRAGTTIVTGGSYTGNPGAEATDVTGAVINIPDGGNLRIADATLTVASAGSDPNTLFLAYGTESAKNGAGTVTLTRVHVVDHSGTGGNFANGANTPGAVLVIGEGCTYGGALAPQTRGWASVSGAFAQAAA